MVGATYHSNGAVIEGSATALQDLVNGDIDDMQEVAAGSYLAEVRRFLTQSDTGEEEPPGLLDSAAFYGSAVVLQYWAERFGSVAGEMDLEDRLAAFVDSVMSAAGPTHHALDAALGTNDVQLALRDFYVTALNSAAPNVTPVLNRRYQLLDLDLAHGDPDGLNGGSTTAAGTPYPRLVTMPANLDGSATIADALDYLQGRVHELTLTNEPDWIRIEIEPTAPARIRQPGDIGPFPTAYAFIPIESDDSARLLTRYMPLGPGPGDPADPLFVRVSDAERLAIVAVAGEFGSAYQVHLSEVAGLPSLTIDAPTQSNPSEPGLERNPVVEIELRPRFGTELVSRLAADQLSVTIGSEAAIVDPPVRVGDHWDVTARAQNWMAGTYDLVVEWEGITETAVDAVILPEAEPAPAPPPSEQASAIGVFEALGQGESDSMIATVAPDAGSARFTLAYAGGDYDFALTTPSLRQIDEASTDPDVTVVSGPDSVTIEIDSPESGIWQMTAHGAAVTSPQDVHVSAVELDTPVRSAGAIATGTAGEPMSLSLSLATADGAVHDAAAVATITDPAGVTRHFELTDDGGPGDNYPADGVYGATVWATQLAGAYNVLLEVSGEDESGQPMTRVINESVSLAPMVDADSDGIADSIEARWGLDPSDGADAATDHDGDGLDLLMELAEGTDPLNWDSDGGGENDASELASARDPRMPDDDQIATRPVVYLEPRDNWEVGVHVATEDGTGSIELYRLDASGVTLVDTLSGAGDEWIDQAFAETALAYLAVAVDVNGDKSAPATSPVYVTRADAVRPRFSLWLNAGAHATNDATVEARIANPSEPLTEVRFGESVADLASAAWIPYAAVHQLEIGPADGRYAVYAQGRDAAGTPSGYVIAAITLDSVAPQSSAETLPAITTGPSVDVPYQAEDDASGVVSTELWVRFRLAPIDPWGEWALGASGGESPITYTFEHGAGHYEFYTVSIDAAGNREDPPSAADTATLAVP